MRKCGKREIRHYYKFFPASNLEYTEDTISSAVKIRIILLLSITGRCPIELMCFGDEDLCRGEKKEKEPQHSHLSLVPVLPQHV